VDLHIDRNAAQQWRKEQDLSQQARTI